ncbi:hypothetical protein MBCUT_12600 [Methanobrevibacter cuticularis]|uniref:Uncharacterized protein n=1 Tax=Methanobrevibacter cuticularis TaxID=47311 RepID=A0A166CP59_9EURY|nr:hypothetical protein [Methanobrevibacter cuticularis]KZX15757.1 hypothetical protein MBCUT_12600 [Methanobrevibacter cuticularis]
MVLENIIHEKLNSQMAKHTITVSSDDLNYIVNPVLVEFETQNNNDTNNFSFLTTWDVVSRKE